MTMPHLMNCPHSADGWCLNCVAKLNAELAEAMGRLRAATWLVWSCAAAINEHNAGLCLPLIDAPADSAPPEESEVSGG